MKTVKLSLKKIGEVEFSVIIIPNYSQARCTNGFIQKILGRKISKFSNSVKLALSINSVDNFSVSLIYNELENIGCLSQVFLNGNYGY